MLSISEEVLALLVDNELDHKDIVKKLALYYPDVLNKLLHLDDLVYQVQEAYTSQNGGSPIVSAIKKYRELTGTQLKDAKLAIEGMLEAGTLVKSQRDEERDFDAGWPDIPHPEDGS